MTWPLPALPPTLRFIQRDWLSANHILLDDGGSHTLIDTGYLSRAATTRAKLLEAIEDAPLTRIVNTHAHSDHMGCNAYLQRWYGCPIFIPEGEAALIERWDPRELTLGYADQIAERFAIDALLVAGQVYRWGWLDWAAINTPGHDDGTLVFYNAAHKILISADALWERGFGFIQPRAIDPTAIERARASFELLATLDVEIVLPGHGAAFTDYQGALARANARLDAYAADDTKVQRNVVKGLFNYALLAKTRMPLSGLAEYVTEVGLLADYNGRFFEWSAQDYGAWLAEEAVRARVACIDGDWLVALE